MATPKKFYRDFALIFFAQFTFTTVFSILLPTIPIYLAKSGSKGAEIGILVGIFSITSLIVRPFVGRALYSISEKMFMIIGTLLYTVASVVYLIAPPFWPLFIVRAFQGIGLALFSTASFTLLANIVPEERRGQFISYFYLSFNLAFALGPYFGILLINHINAMAVFLACTGLSFCSFFLTLKLSQRGVFPAGPPSKPPQSLLSREAVSPAIMALMLNFIWGGMGAFFPLYALKHGVANPGVFFIFLSVTLASGRLFGARILDLYRREKIMALCLIVIVIALSLFPFSTTLKMFILIAVILGIGWALLYPSLMVHAIESSVSQGPAMATFTALGDLGIGIGPMIMGAILQWTSFPVMFVCLALTGAANLLFFYFTIWKKAGMSGTERKNEID